MVPVAESLWQEQSGTTTGLDLLEKQGVAVTSLDAVSLLQPQKVTAEELEFELQQERTVPLIIDFYATWCGPCLLLATELEKVWRWFPPCTLCA